MLGLRWGDVDFEAGTSTCGISSRVRKRGTCEGHAAEDARRPNGASTRPRAVPRAGKAQSSRHGLEAGGLRLHHRDGQAALLPQRGARGLDKAADRAGLNPEGVQRLSFHDLRHTAITHLIRSGADAAQVSASPVTRKVSTTLDLYVGEFEKRRVNDSAAASQRSSTEPQERIQL